MATLKRPASQPPTPCTHLQGLKTGAVPGPDALPSFQELQAAVGFPEYFEEEARYTVPSSDAASGSAASSTFGGTTAAASSSSAAAAASGVEPDLVLEPGASGSSPEAAASSGTIDLYDGSTDGSDGGSGRSRAAATPQWVRVRITDTRAGKTTLDTRFPAGRCLPLLRRRARGLA